MNRAALPFVIIAAGLGGLFLWARCSQERVEPTVSASEGELKRSVEDILTALPQGVEWSGERYVGVSRSVLSPEARAAVEAVGSDSFARLLTSQILRELEGAAESPPKIVVQGSGMQEWVEIQIALGEGQLSLGDRQAALKTLVGLAGATSVAVGTSRTMDELQTAGIARLRFLNWATASLKDGEWRPEESAQIEEQCTLAGHRDALGAAVQRRFIGENIKRIADASLAKDTDGALAAALYDDPPADVARLLGAILKGHPRGFNPHATAKAGAESVRQFRDALAEPWQRTQKILDLVREVQAVWSDFTGFLASGDTSAAFKIKGVKERIDSTENPVGLALLHRERTSWSNLAQSAYVADSQEAQFRLAAMRAAGHERLFPTVLDPLTGDAYKIEGNKASSDLTDPGDEYRFVKELVSGPRTF